MNHEFITTMEHTLNSHRQELINTLVETNAAFRNLMEEGGETGDAIDEASDVIDRKMLEALGVKDMNRLQLINSAIARIHLGKYGLCMKCGKQIPEERLQAIPHAILCVECKSADERRNR